MRYKDIVAIVASPEFPSNVREWSLCDRAGWSIAHEAAKQGKIPNGFNQWEIADRIAATSVAHVAARYGNLPKGFDCWELKARHGWTVAHEAALFDNLPDCFDLWELQRDDGMTVMDVYEIWSKKRKKIG
mgnify:CR=1 FL=1